MMLGRLLLMVVVSVVSGACLAHADPVINSVSGTLTHRGTITINGTQFGTKSPAAPLMWDDGEDSVVNDQASVLSQGWVDPWPRSGTSSLEHKIQYRNSGYRNVTGPHSRSAKFLAGGHYQTLNNSPAYIGTGAEDYRAVMLTADAGSGRPRWFALFYYRLDPLWKRDCPPFNNHKTSVIQAGVGGYTGGMSYIAYRGQAPECGDDNRFAYHATGNCDIGSFPEDYPSTNNPANQWVHYEERIADDSAMGFRNLYIDNKAGLKFNRNCPRWFSSQFPTGIRSYTVGGYYRWATDINSTDTYRGDVNNFRYFDDVYVDTTLSRVVLANNAIYENATIIEPQIPEAWNDGQITVRVNLGRLPANGTAYLFVFDGDDRRSNGVCVALGTGRCGDNVPPSPPPNAR